MFWQGKIAEQNPDQEFFLLYSKELHLHYDFFLYASRM